MTEWQSRAACRGSTANFFPARAEDLGPALEICATCPVKGACREHGLHNEYHGVWGGTSERERQRIRKRLNIMVLRPETRSEILEGLRHRARSALIPDERKRA